MSNLKYINKVLMTTLLVFSIPTFANYSKTTSKYVKDNYVALESDMSFVNPSGNGEMTLLRGNWTEIQYKVTFNRNTYVDKDTYELEVPSGCLIDKNGVNSRAVSTINKNKVTLEYHDKNVEKAEVSYTCQVADLNGTAVDANTTRVTTFVKVYETMDDFKFLFFKDTRITEVRKPHGYVDGDKSEYYYLPDIPELTSSARKKEIEDWITVTYPEANGIEDLKSYIISYLDSVSRDDITAIDLGGLDVSEETIDGQKYYKFHLTDDFIGYVKTYRGRSHKKELYFSNTNITESRANEVLDDYLRFFYPNNEDGTASEEFTKIRNYIRDNGGIYQVIKGTGSIRGITAGDTSDLFILSDTIMTYIDIFNGEEIKIEYSNTNFNAQTITSDILTMLKLKYAYLPENISEDRDLYMAIFMKAITFNNQKVDEYISYTIKDTSEQIIIHLISNMDEKVYVSAVKLSNTEPIVLTTRTNSAYYNISSIKEFIGKIDEETVKSDTLEDTVYSTIDVLDSILVNGGTASVQNGDFEDTITVTITNDKGDLTNQKVEIKLTHTRGTTTADHPIDEETTVTEPSAADQPEDLEVTEPLKEKRTPVIDPQDGEIPNTEIGTQEPIDTPPVLEEKEEQEEEEQTPEKQEEQPLIKQEEEETTLEIQKEEIKD